MSWRSVQAFAHHRAVPTFQSAGTNFCSNTGFIPLAAFSSAQDAKFNALNAEVSKALEIGAVAAAMKDAIPKYRRQVCDPSERCRL